jgi:hypothetical protein
MEAWCPNKKVDLCASKSEMTDCSIEARYWIQGFLSGNEPDAPVDELGDYLPDDYPKREKWRAAVRQFPETGLWVTQDRKCETCEDELLPTQPGMKCPKCS